MDAQKRKKTYFGSNKNYQQKKRRQFVLAPGIRGFLCTCNSREKDCVREAYNLLNEFADKLYGPDKSWAPQSGPSAGEKGPMEKPAGENWRQKNEASDDEDISSALSKEIAELKAEADKPVAERRFQVVDTGVKSVVFIRTTLPEPSKLTSAIVEELDKTKTQKTRFLLRLLPIEVVCKAYMDDIKLKADELLDKYFSQEPKTFSIVFNRHCNQALQRTHVIEDLAEIISKKNPGNKADLSNPELAVVVEVIRGVCLLSVVPGYFKYRKYNLLEICGVKETDKKKTSVDSETTDCKEEEDEKEAVDSEMKDLETKEENNLLDSESKDPEAGEEKKVSGSEKKDAEEESDRKQTLELESKKDTPEVKQMETEKD